MNLLLFFSGDNDEALPFARIAELRMRVVCPNNDDLRPITRQQRPPAHYRELWSGEMLLAGLSKSDATKLQAFLEAKDGRLTPFHLTLEGGKFSQNTELTATLFQNTVRGADSIRLAFATTGATLKAGTLITLGDIDSSSYQLLEVLQDVTTAANTLVYVAPRIRKVFATSAKVDLGTVIGKFNLADDMSDVRFDLTHGMPVLRFVETL